MKTLNMRCALSAALTGLALAAVTQISYAAHDVVSETEIGGVAEASQLAPVPAIARIVATYANVEACLHRRRECPAIAATP